MRSSWLAATLLAGLLSAAPAPTAAPPELKYVVVFSRHGVRSPTWELSRLNEYSAQPWPDWGVSPGDLTPHGRAAIKLLGAYYHDWLSGERLLDSQECRTAAKIYIWADKDQRTLETGRALAESLLPGCVLATHSRVEDGADPLFSGVGTADPELALKAVQTRLGSNPQKLLRDHEEALTTLRSLLSGGQKVANDFVKSSPEVGVAVKGTTVGLNGPFDVSSTFSENLLLEYADGMQGQNLGWGRLNLRNLFQVLELHATYADLMRRTPYIARSRGSNLLQHVLDSMEQAVSGAAVPGAIGQPSDRALFLVGHDTNQSNLSGMLDLNWTLPGYQPNETPPGSGLIFSLWRGSGDGAWFVKTQFVAQSLDQMRNLARLTPGTPPEKTDVSIPGCQARQTKDGCPWPVFQHILEGAVDRHFVQ